MDHHNGLTTAFIHVVIFEAVNIHEVGLKRVQVSEALNVNGFSFQHSDSIVRYLAFTKFIGLIKLTELIE